MDVVCARPMKWLRGELLWKKSGDLMVEVLKRALALYHPWLELVGFPELLKLKQLFRPDQKDMGSSLVAVTGLVMALKSLGCEASVQDLAMVTLKAEIMQESWVLQSLGQDCLGGIGSLE